MSDTITGSTIADRYKVTGLLRSGRMGDVYVARRPDGRRVSIKILDPGLFDNAEAVKRFERETRITRTIDHACSMRVLDSGHDQAGHYLILEYVEGDLLSDLIEERGALAPERAARIAAQIAMALRAAHRAGVIHRDLAPSNVVIAQQGSHEDIVKVSDFGLALLTHDDDDDDHTNLTAVGVRIGTPTYMAPEYIEEYELDHRADIYGLGIMLFQMLTGSPPYTGRPYKVMDQHVNAEIPTPSERLANVPAWLDSLVLAMMAKSPDDRIQTADEVVLEIEQHLGHPVAVHEWISPTARPVEARVEVVPDNADDPILDHLITQHTLSITRSADPPPPAHTLFHITRVAATSLAGAAGVRPGWRLHLPDRDRGLLDPDVLIREVVDERTYHFYPPQGERLALSATGIPIGIEVVRSPENIRKHYDPLEPVAGALLDLWRQECWVDLEKLAWRTVTRQKGTAAARLGGALFSRFLGNDKPTLRDHPALLLLGAAQIEQDRHAEGSPRVREFHGSYLARWPAIYAAIASLYLARDALRRRETDGVPDLARQAVLLGDLRPARILYERLTGETLQTQPWLGRVFNDYSMDSTDDRRSARLSETCGRMDGSQLLAVCMMGGFRGNADYDAFMYRYATFAAFFTDFLTALHVVTTATDRESERPEHYQGEDFVAAAGLDVVVLHDYRAFVQRAVKPGAIPTIYLLDQTGTCVHEGALSPVDLWDALVLAARNRVERLETQ